MALDQFSCRNGVCKCAIYRDRLSAVCGDGREEWRAGRGDLHIQAGKGSSLELRVQFPAGDKVFTPNPDDLLAVALHITVDAREGRLLLQLGHPGGMCVHSQARAVSSAWLAARDGGRLQPLLKVSVSHSSSHSLAVLIVIAEDVRFLDVLLLLILRKVKLFLHPAVSVPTMRGLLGLFFRAACVDGIWVNGKPVSGQPPPSPPKRLAWGWHCAHTKIKPHRLFTHGTTLFEKLVFQGPFV